MKDYIAKLGIQSSLIDRNPYNLVYIRICGQSSLCQLMLMRLEWI